MSTAEELRQAGHHIRDRAAEATAGPWNQEHHGGHIVHGPGATVAEAAYEPGDAAHIALWDPAITDLIGCWLICVATDEDELAGLPQTPARAREVSTALHIARKINTKAAEAGQS